MDANLPSGLTSIQQVLRTGFYVDKTEYVNYLLTSGKHIVIIRPRRFGKTLFIDTIEVICRGKMSKSLFAEFFIGKEENKYQWERFPVIRIDFSGFNVINLHEELIQRLVEIAKKHKKTIITINRRKKAKSLTVIINEVFAALKNAKGYVNEIVCLIDEYDFPILNASSLSINADGENLTDDPERLKTFRKQLRETNLNILQEFFRAVKANATSCRLQFVTGITKYSLSELFIAANHLEDITLAELGGTMFGFTQEEVETTFNRRIDEVVRKMNSINGTNDDRNAFMLALKNMYDGYRFWYDMSISSLYAPISVVNALSQARLSDFWSQTGSSSFVIHEMLNHSDEYKTFLIDMDDLELEVVENELLYSSSPDSISSISLLFQTGYLTISRFNLVSNKYVLKFPNEDVKRGFRFNVNKCVEEEVKKFRY